MKKLVIRYVFLAFTTFGANFPTLNAQQYSTIENFNHLSATSTSAIMHNGHLYLNGWMVDSVSPYRNLNLFAEIDTSSGMRLSYKKFSLSTWDLNFEENCFLKLPDGRFVSGGAINLGARCVLLFYDSTGSVQDTLLIQDSTSIHFYPKNLVYRDNVLYFLIGRTENDYDGNLWLLKVDLMGNILWSRTYGVANLTEEAGSMLNLDTCILIGANRSTLNHVPSIVEEQSHTWLFTIDTAGNLINEWIDPDDRTYWPDRMIKMSGNKVILAGGYRDDPVWNDNYEVWWKGYVASFDLNSWSKTWWKKYGNLTPITYFHDLDSVNGGYILSGADAIDTPVITSDPAGWLMKVDLNGNKIWENKYLPFPSGTISNCTLKETMFLPSGDFISVGWADNGNFHGWILRTDSAGCLVPNCSYIGIEEQLPLQFSVYPNPAQTQISFRLEDPANIELRVYDLLGQPVFSKDFQTSYQLDITNWPKGLYVYGLSNNGILRASGKFIVE